MTRTPDRPPIIESKPHEYRDTGIPSKVAIAGHPLHPAIVTLPIGFLVAAFTSDWVYWWTGDPFWTRASFWLLIGGLATGLLAGLTGMFDFIGIRRTRTHGAGWIHMIGNVAALILTAINIGLRWNNITQAVLPTGIILSTSVAVLLLITGWYGGELVYRHKIAVLGHTDDHSS